MPLTNSKINLVKAVLREILAGDLIKFDPNFKKKKLERERQKQNKKILDRLKNRPTQKKLPATMTWADFVDYCWGEGKYSDLLDEMSYSLGIDKKFEERTKDLAESLKVTLTDENDFSEDTWHEMYKASGLK